MNHSHAFRKVNQEIRADLAKLRAKNYFGDGFWSAGRPLTGGKSDTPMGEDEQPNYTWSVYPLISFVPVAKTDSLDPRSGGARKKSRQRKPRAPGAAPRRAAGSVNPGKTGRQTAIPRKAGGRVTKADAFFGLGHTLSKDPAQSTFRFANSLCDNASLG